MTCSHLYSFLFVNKFALCSPFFVLFLLISTMFNYYALSINCSHLNKTKILGRQLNCSVKLALFAPRMTSLRASSRNVGKFYRTVKLSTKNLRFIHADCNWERCHLFTLVLLLVFVLVSLSRSSISFQNLSIFHCFVPVIAILCIFSQVHWYLIPIPQFCIIIIYYWLQN